MCLPKDQPEKDKYVFNLHVPLSMHIILGFEMPLAVRLPVVHISQGCVMAAKEQRRFTGSVDVSF